MDENPYKSPQQASSPQPQGRADRWGDTIISAAMIPVGLLLYVFAHLDQIAHSSPNAAGFFSAFGPFIAAAGLIRLLILMVDEHRRDNEHS